MRCSRGGTEALTTISQLGILPQKASLNGRATAESGLRPGVRCEAEVGKRPTQCFRADASAATHAAPAPELDELASVSSGARETPLLPWRSERLARRSTDECSSSVAIAPASASSHARSASQSSSQWRAGFVPTPLHSAHARARAPRRMKTHATAGPNPSARQAVPQRAGHSVQGFCHGGWPVF